MESANKNIAEVGNTTSAMKTNSNFSSLEKEFYDAEIYHKFKNEFILAPQYQKIYESICYENNYKILRCWTQNLKKLDTLIQDYLIL